MDKLVSILIPVFNREGIISETVESALAQTYTNIEVIIVDNASTDDTWHIVQKYTKKDSRVKAFRNNTNIGPVRNWKRCIDEATGYYGKILWSDDLISPDFLEKTLPLFDVDIGFVITKVKVFNNTMPAEDGVNIYDLGRTGGYPMEQYIESVLVDPVIPVSPGCAIFRLADLKENLIINIPNKFNCDFSMHAIGNDLLIFLLTAKRYKNFYYLGEAVSFFRDHESSITTSTNSTKLAFFYAYVKAYFIESKIKKFQPRMESYLWLMFFRSSGPYPFGTARVQDFFECSVGMDLKFLARLIFYSVLRTLKRVASKAF